MERNIILIKYKNEPTSQTMPLGQFSKKRTCFIFFAIKCLGGAAVSSGQKQKNFYLFFCSGGHKTHFNALFWMLKLGHICCICVSIYQSNPRMESRGYLVNKNTSFVASGIGVLMPPEHNNKSENIESYMINRSLGPVP